MIPMQKTLILGLLLFLSWPALAFQQNPTESYYQMIDQKFSADEAFNTVAFMDKFWRIPGNTGFNESIYKVVKRLEEAGFKEESEADSADRLIYRIEKRPMRVTTWEPVSGYIKLSNGETLLDFKTNRHMMAINSHSTDGEQEYEIVYVGSGRGMDFSDAEGKIAYGEGSVGRIHQLGVERNGAVGAIGYSLPSYLQPEKNTTSIQFGAIRRNEEKRGFGLLLSYEAKQKLDAALKAGDNKVKVKLETKIYNAEELTLVAELRGSTLPEERFVFSAHVQEPGANDNASGVGALQEVAVTSARLLQEGSIDPERTITYLFGDEISSTRRFIEEDEARAANIKWGMSLDMVGENTDITGGSFLIEKMPDPAAIWTRGKEKHSEWGGSPLKKEQLKPHYFNDLVISQFKWIGKKKNWEVNFNPYEGGSDHVPFLRADIPGLLLWHFTDQFYHTDNDRIENVSKETLKNVGTGALMIALMLTENKDWLPNHLLSIASTAAMSRLNEEHLLSKEALSKGSSNDVERDILSTWSSYYRDVLNTVQDIKPKDKNAFETNLKSSQDALSGLKNRILSEFN